VVSVRVVVAAVVERWAEPMWEGVRARIPG
jgi:hypothetical protein